MSQQFGSLQNFIMGNAVTGQPAAAIGMAATLLYWTDREPATVIATFTRGERFYIVVQEDTARRVDGNGFSECQAYVYERNPKGGSYTFRQTKSGRWEQVRFSTKTNRYQRISQGVGLRLGERRKYHDFSF